MTLTTCILCKEELGVQWHLDQPHYQHYFCQNPKCVRYGLLCVLLGESPVIDVHHDQPAARIPAPKQTRRIK
jgi:hypothetical protein